MNPKVVLAMSGGLDSTVTYANLVKSNYEVITVHFQYGSKHNRWEIASYLALAKHYGFSPQVVNLKLDFLKSALTSPDIPIPEGHYNSDNMKQTVVPCRNLILISYLAAIATQHTAPYLALGVHTGDHHIYPDCRPSFIHAAEVAARVASDNIVTRILTPFGIRVKSSLVLAGLELNVPFQLTRTCYSDQPTACGKCGSCQERLEAFAEVNAVDPLTYHSRDLFPKETV